MFGARSPPRFGEATLSPSSQPQATRDGITRRLLASGCDFAAAADRGTYRSLDAMEAVSQIMVGGRLDATRVAAFVDDYERSRLAVSASNVTVVGEMAALLCRDGHGEAALQLEHALGMT